MNMKRILYLLPLVIAFASGCSPKSAPAPSVPEGTFSGKFKYQHEHAQTGALDSATANLQVQIEQTTYTVTGDTSTVHAGSFGTYEVNSYGTAIAFFDKTYPTTGTPKKFHLSGIYSYSYDGKNLQIVSFGAFDTLSYSYSLVKTGN